MTLRAIGCLLAVVAMRAAAQETLTVAVGPANVSPISFELRQDRTIRTAEMILYQGDAALVTPLGRMILAQSDLQFIYAPGTDRVEAVRGRALVPTPLSGEEISIDEPVIAELGYDTGANITDAGVPLHADRGYLYFKFDAGLTLRIGKRPSEDIEEEEDTSFTLQFPAGASSRIVVDPLDPFFYFAGAVATPNKSPKPGEPGGQGGGTSQAEPEDDGISIGLGNSRQGLIPFRPLVTWGIEDFAREFSGHRIVTGSFPLYSLPVTVRGHLITNLDPLATGMLAVDPFGLGFGPVVQAGANGRFAFSLDFLKVTGLGNIANLTIPLGKATAAVEIVNDRQAAYLSGIIDPATELGMGLLLSQDGELKTAAVLSTDPAANRLLMEGRYKIGMSEFAKLVKIDLGNLLYAGGTLRADRTGFFLRARTETGVTLGPLRADGAVGVEMEVPASGTENSYAQLSGLLKLSGMGVDGIGRITRYGIAATGKVVGPQFDMTLNGGVTASSNVAVVEGSMSVPAALQPDLNAEIRAQAASVQRDLDAKLSALEEATKDLEFELSLRGIRPAIPPAADTIIAEINRQIPANLNARWPKVSTIFGPIEAPGKQAALDYANGQAEPYRARLRELKRLAQTGDNASVRRALESAILSVLNNPRLQITYRVPVIGVTITIADVLIVDATLRARLNTALAGVRALPEASNIRLKAQQVWDALPKREILRATADAIERGVTASIPRIETIGFRFPLGRLEWEYQVVVRQQNARPTITVRLAPESIGSIGTAIGRAFAQALN
jgi:hypothetical protein